MTSFWLIWAPTVYALWAGASPILLGVTVFLLWRHQSRRDFYVVRHLGYDLVFKENPGSRLYITAERGPFFGGFIESFSEFGAAKAFFDQIEETRSGWSTEEVNQIFMVRGRKPPSVNSLAALPKVFAAEKPWPASQVTLPGGGLLLQSTPSSGNYARRREACEEYKALNYPDLP